MAQELATVTIETSVTPQITLRASEVLGKGGAPSAVSDLLLSIVRPRVTVVSPFGTTVSAPYGKPFEPWWVGLLIIAVPVGILGYLLVKKAFK